MKDDVDAWLEFYADTTQKTKRWGRAEDQLMIILANLKAVIEQAQSFHTALGNTCHSHTHVVFSDGLDTDVSYDATKSGFGSKVIKQSAGDATVPSASGACPDFPATHVRSRRAIPELDHAAVFGDLTFNNHVIALLQTILGGLVGPIPRLTK